MLDEEADHKSFVNKHGTNFTKSHPEVFKLGKLKKAKLLAKEGEYEKAMSTLAEGFNIKSLMTVVEGEKSIIQNMVKNSMILAKQKRLEEESKLNQTGNLDSKLNAQSKGKNSGNAGIAHLKENPAENQKAMPQEDYKNKKLIPILDEALDFYKELVTRKANAEKKLLQIERTKQKLIE